MSKISEYELLKSTIDSVSKLSNSEIKYLIKELEAVVKYKSIRLQGFRLALDEVNRRERRNRIRRENKAQ